MPQQHCPHGNELWDLATALPAKTACGCRATVASDWLSNGHVGIGPPPRELMTICCGAKHYEGSPVQHFETCARERTIDDWRRIADASPYTVTIQYERDGRSALVSNGNVGL